VAGRGASASRGARAAGGEEDGLGGLEYAGAVEHADEVDDLDELDDLDEEALLGAPGEIVDLGPEDDLSEDEARARDAADDAARGDSAFSPGFSPFDDEVKLAVIGRPNVGKSSILNALLGDVRHVVHAAPGTTRDAITSHLQWDGVRMLVCDTAGIRRDAAGGRRREEVDRMAVLRALQMVKASQVTMVVFDACEGLVRQDMRIAHIAIEHKKSCVLVANKCDLLNDVQLARVEEDVRAKLPMLRFAPIVRTCALTGEGLSDALDLCVEAARWRRERVPKRRLNELFERAQVLRPLPMNKGARLRIRYVTQGDTETPTFVFYMNRADGWRDGDERWMENIVRSQWPFTATPLRLVFRAHGRHRGKQVEAPETKRERMGVGWSALQALKQSKRKRAAAKAARLADGGEPKPTGRAGRALRTD